MDVVSRETFRTLVDASSFPSLSIYMPTHRAGPEIAQDPIRLKNLVGEARRRLVEIATLRGPEADRLLEPIVDLISDSGFWQQQVDGLALFRAPELFRSFRLPVAVGEQVVLGETFHLKPLLPAIGRGERFYILALSRQNVRLLSGTRFSVSDVDLGEIPTSIADALPYEDLERQLQFHQSGSRGKATTVFHGQGGTKDTTTNRLERFFRTIDRGVNKLIEPDAPLVLAGVEYLLPIYRSVSRHTPILDGDITGSPDVVRDGALHERGWGIARSFFEKERDAALLTLASGAAPTEQTVGGVVRAAREGRVAHLFIDPSATVWGSLEAERVVRHDTRRPGDVDLLDLSVAQTWRHGGTVFLGAPGDSVAAAVLRY